MRFPYGICDFNKIITKGYFYCDRTDRIRTLEDTGDSLLFLRPRRFGKSLLLSMLANYYDIALAERFEEIFGNLAIGKNPTELHNKYFILDWDFSCVNASGSADDIRQSLYNHINNRIKAFLLYYADYSLPEVEINPEDAIASIESLIASVRMTPYPVYLLIDEYDNFANEVMMGRKKNSSFYESLVYGDGLIKTLFKAIKAFASESLFDRTFVTGVSPVVMSDITSGYNIAESIFFYPELDDLCGITEEEIGETIYEIASKCGMDDNEAKKALNMMRVYYNGYTFSYDSDTNIYNPTLAIYFMKEFHKRCKYPREMLDENLAADHATLEYISEIKGGEQLLFDLIEGKKEIVVSQLAKRFGIKRILSDQSKDYTFMASLLYYFGILTMAGETSNGELELVIPNLVSKGLYVECLIELLLPDPEIRDEGVFAAKKLYQKGDIKPACEFIENKYFKVFSNRDYIWANELTVKTAFLTLLYNDILYIMDSEAENERSYTDLTMIIRPDKRKFTISDILLEFKFVKVKEEAGLTGEKAKELTVEELKALPAMQAKMKEAKKQLCKYGDKLEQKYKDLRLKRFAVVALGFERLWAEEL